MIAVVVQDAHAVTVRERRDKQVDGREAVMARTSELALGIQGTPLDLLVDLEVGECLEFRRIRAASLRRRAAASSRSACSCAIF